MGSYPLVLDLTGRRAVVVGGGGVALRRARGLLDAGALVHVVAPAVLPELAAAGVVVHPRPYGDGDLAGAWVVHACTDDPAVNAAVAAEAERRRVPCVRADSAAAGTARTPAVARAAGVVVAVSTEIDERPDADPIGSPTGYDTDRSGPDPSREDRSAVAHRAHRADRADRSDPAGDSSRDRDPQRAGADPGRAAAVRDAITLLIEGGELPLRRHRPAPAGSLGRVALVGGGPGDPDLLTVRGR
ncbi:MAG TPA: NAD(P)-dependent oxidoreductase, partial [Mycobacteriales bacterium]|nr:NAD(P)-dependent oxidoreductase [Mycobacteriales bacterium]